MTERLLFRVSNLDIGLKTKFLIYYSQYCYENDKSLLNSNKNIKNAEK